MLQGCGQTFDECVEEAAKDGKTELAFKFLAEQCLKEHSDD